MDFDEFDYLEKAVEPSESLKDSRGADYKEKEKDRSRKSRVSEEARDWRHERHKHHYRSKKTRVFDEDAERSERDGDRSERGWQKKHERFSPEKTHDRDRPKHDNRERKRRDEDCNVRDGEQERVDGWHAGGRGGGESFYGRSRDVSGGRARGREDWHFDKKVEKEDRLSHGEKDLGESRYSRERKKKKEEAASTEPKDNHEQDQRTVFVYQISLKANERDVYNFFSKAGKVRDVRLIMDRNLRRSKGMGYVEFYDAMSVPMAIAMTGQLLLGQPVLIKPSEAEKNMVHSTDGASGAGAAMGPHNGGARRLYVGNLHYNITENQLRQVFESFGPLDFVQLSRDSVTRQSKGYAFIQFARLEDAQCAQTSLNGTLELAGRVIKVSMVTEQSKVQEPGLGTGELDGDDGGSLCLTSWSRTLLMRKLDHSRSVTSITGSNRAPSSPPLVLLPGAPPLATNSAPLVLGSVAQPGMTGMVGLSTTGLAASTAAAAIGAPSQYLLLKNMFDPSTETDADFDLDIKDEVQSECSKFGAVKHIYVDKDYGCLEGECICAFTTFELLDMAFFLFLLNWTMLAREWEAAQCLSDKPHPS